MRPSLRASLTVAKRRVTVFSGRRLVSSLVDAGAGAATTAAVEDVVSSALEAVATSGGGKGAAEKDGEGKGKGGAKRTKSAPIPGGQNNSELASHESSTSHKSPSVDGVKSSEKKEGESNAESERGAKLNRSQETTPSADEKKPAHGRLADHTPPSAGEVKSSSSTGSGDEE